MPTATALPFNEPSDAMEIRKCLTQVFGLSGPTRAWEFHLSLNGVIEIITKAGSLFVHMGDKVFVKNTSILVSKEIK